MKRHFFYQVFLVLIAIATCSIFPTSAAVRLPKLVSDSMILQRDKPLKIWGFADVGERVTVKFKGGSYRVKTGADGKWLVDIPAQKAGGPYDMTISGSNTIKISNILIGDVWFCSGQSNMVHQMWLHRVLYEKDIAEANYPEIRQFWIPTRALIDRETQDYEEASWKAATPFNVRDFSAVAYFMVLDLYKKYHVPMGIINASVGGTPIEAWISESGYDEGFPNEKAAIARHHDTAFLNGLNRRRPGGGATQQGPRPQAPVDKGTAGTVKWYDPAFQPKNWRTINIPGYWEDQGVKNLDGVVWYRREIDIPANMVGKPATVYLGRIVDADELYVNGKQVGNTTYQYPQRRYYIPEGLLKPGKNLFVVRVTNNSGKGGFVSDKPYYVFYGADTVDLKGYWEYKVGQVTDRRSMSRGGFGGGGGINAQNEPAGLFNGMVAPAVNYQVRGFVWYQGESNAGKPKEYLALQEALVNNWRKLWGEGELPFLWVQLPNYMDVNYLPEESGWAELRESQAKALRLPNTAMAVAIDLGEWNDIHPDRKKEVGQRLALAAEALSYGEQIAYSGPMYDTAVIEGNKITISFKHADGGLATTDGEAPEQVAIAGDDKRFYWANTRIEGEKLVVWSDQVPNPKYVRYAWADNPDNPNLVNKAGLPASPFRTDQ